MLEKVRTYKETFGLQEVKFWSATPIQGSAMAATGESRDKLCYLEAVFTSLDYAILSFPVRIYSLSTFT